ncbi:conserved Plasmodium membrane protein, unknown function [Plasmodium sp. gorilla clade G3]|nr:conserved Plasmodium membrane protein, unknown function [Plasmodium sp. gorilla clade G3]
MKLKSYYFYIDIILLIFILYLKRCCKGYVLNVNVVDKDDLFVFLYKNEHLLASSYYNLKPSYFFSFDEGEININLNIHFKENTYVRKRNISQEVHAKSNLNSINILTHFSLNEEYLKKYNFKRDYTSKEISTTYDDNNNNNNKENYDIIKKKYYDDKNQNNNTCEEVSDNLKNDNLDEKNKSNNLFLVLITADQWLNYIRLKNKLEPSLHNDENYIFTSHFNCIKRYPLDEGIIKKTIKIEHKNRYMLVLINNHKLRITLKGNVVFYDYKTKHLSYDYLFIPNVLYFTTIVLLILVIIISLYFLRYREKSDIFMVLNMIFFLLSTYLNYKNINFIKDMGYMYMYYWISANILKKMQEIVTFIIYLQVSLGDMYIRTHLSRIEIQFMICFSVISFYTGLYEIFLGNFQAPRYILQAFAYLFIFIAINFTSTFLSARLAEENLSFHVAELYKKYDIYKKYRLIFFAVILKPILLIIYKVLCLSPSNIDLYSSHEFLYIFFDINFDIIVYILLFILFRTVEPIKFLKHILSNENFHID